MTIKHFAPYINCLIVLTGMAAIFFSAGCNSSDDETETKEYLTTESVAITDFSLSPDVRVMRNLDSVFFSIDLEHGVVFNADSLPKGTNVTKLIPVIKYPSSVTSASIEMYGGSHRVGTVNYLTNPNDTIDFTGKVILTLGASNGTVSKEYELKVNVHKEEPDTIYWDRLGTMELPSRLGSPKAQKSVEYGSGVLCLIEENDGTYTLAKTDDIFAGQWSKNAVSFGNGVNLESFTAVSGGNLYLLDTEGNLLVSADGLEWNAEVSGWESIIGIYNDMLIGEGGNSSARSMVSWPGDMYAGIQLPEGFPASGFSSPVEFANRWAESPTIVLFGGVTPSGQLSQASWAFDGTQWANISSRPLPALEGVAVVGYYSYLKSASNGILREFDAYLAFGGRDAGGNLNNTVYITYDHGINWQTAQGYMQMPEGVEAGFSADAISLGSSMESNLSNRWKTRRRIPFEVDGDKVIWDCPYIFLFGGYDSSRTLNTTIRSGVLQRLTFVPLF